MFIILPLGAFFLLWMLIDRFGPQNREVRAPIMAASLVSGTLGVISIEVLSVFNALHRPALIFFWVIICIATYLLISKTPSREPSQLQDEFPNKTNAILILGIIITVMFVGITAIVAPPNNWDSMTYHMSRVAHWVANHNVKFYPTAILRQLFTPPGAEYAIAQLQILSNSDRFANMVQWLSMALSVVGVSSIAKILGAGRRGQILSALIAATLPVGILEASSTQNDYVAAYWLVCFVLFGLKLLKDHRLLTAWFCALSLGLALFTKATTMVFSLPFLAWIVTVGVLQNGKKFWPKLILIATIPLLIGGPQYIRNYQLDGNIFSLPSESKSVNNESPTFQGMMSNSLRYMGLNLAIPNDTFNKGVENTIVGIHDLLNWNIVDPRYTYGDQFRVTFTRHEDTASNTVTALFFLWTVLMFVRRPGDRTAWLYLMSLLSGFFLLCLFVKWQPWGNRFLLPLAVLSAPFMGTILDKSRSSFGIVVAIILFVISIPYVFNNTSRAMISKQYSIFTKSRDEQYFSNLPGMFFSYQKAAQEVGNSGCTNIGIMLTADSWEYPLWTLLGSPQNKKLRIEHVNVSNQSQPFDYPRGGFDPCLVIGNGDIVSQHNVTVNSSSYVKTNQWGYLSLFRKDTEGKLSVLVRNSHLTTMLDNSMNADKLVMQAQKTTGLTSEIIAQVFRLRNEALAHAKQLDAEELNIISPELGIAVETLFIKGNELIVEGLSTNNSSLLNQGQGLLNLWTVWLQKNSNNLQHILK